MMRPSVSRAAGAGSVSRRIEQRVLIRKDERRAALLREQGLEVHQVAALAVASMS